MFQRKLVRKDKSSLNVRDENGKSDWCNPGKGKRKFKENVSEYMEYSTLHGLRYMGDSKITLFERVFFGIAFVMVVSLSVYFISHVYVKWSATPIIVTTSAASLSITDIPFPAVTICSVNKARDSVVKDFHPKSIESAWLKSICYDGFDNITTNYDELPKGTNEWIVFRKYLLNISQPCSKMLMLCRYALNTFSCMERFDTVLSDEGLCCIFNPVDPMFLYKNPNNETTNFDDDEEQNDVITIDWTPENGYLAWAMKRESTPRPAEGAGSHLGLYVILNADVSDYHCSSTNSAGFKVLLHSPAETPQINDFGMLVSPGQESRIIVKPKMQTASRLLRKIPIKKRQCIFSNEANLTYFRTYSRKNCELECYSRIVEEKCGCIVYHMPKINPNANICSQADSKCYNTVLTLIDRADDPTMKCHCLPGCVELSFTGQISSAPLTTSHFQKQNYLANYSAEFIKRDIAIVQVFFTENLFRSLIKDELIGFTEFLSNTGGLLGLFMGFSVVSVVEILYFITLRPYCRQFYTNGVKSQSKKDQSILKLVSKTQRRNWPFAWDHVYEIDIVKTHQKPAQQTYNGQIVQVNRWKPPSYPMVYPYID